jgi:hypothetical protein
MMGGQYNEIVVFLKTGIYKKGYSYVGKLFGMNSSKGSSRNCASFWN